MRQEHRHAAQSEHQSAGSSFVMKPAFTVLNIESFTTNAGAGAGAGANFGHLVKKSMQTRKRENRISTARRGSQPNIIRDKSDITELDYEDESLDSFKYDRTQGENKDFQ